MDNVIMLGWMTLADEPLATGTVFETDLEEGQPIGTAHGIVLGSHQDANRVVLFPSQQASTEAWYRLRHKGRFRAPRDLTPAA